MRKYQVIIATISDGNVRHISRYNVTTARGATRLRGNNCQIWMARETAVALGADVYGFWGTLPDGQEIQIKTENVMETA